MEKVSKHEENVVTVPIKEEMTKEEIMKLVLQRIDGDLPLKEITPPFQIVGKKPPRLF